MAHACHPSEAAIVIPSIGIDIVIPAKAGIHSPLESWMLAFAGMTSPTKPLFQRMMPEY